MSTDIIIHDQKDNVGVVVIEKITPKQDCSCWIMENDSTVNIQSIDEIPLGHKIAMVDLKEGDTILNNSRGFHTINPKEKLLCFIENTVGPFVDKPIETL